MSEVFLCKRESCLIETSALSWGCRPLQAGKSVGLFSSSLLLSSLELSDTQVYEPFI